MISKIYISKSRRQKYVVLRLLLPYDHRVIVGPGGENPAFDVLFDRNALKL